MGKALLFGLLMFGVVLVATATSHGDVPVPTGAPSLPATMEAPPEPITGTPAVPAPGSESTPKDPFAPYAVSATRSYDQLTPDEQAAVDAGRDRSAWPAILDAYNTAVRERAQAAAAAAAQQQLGIDNLAATGVVP